ncbi:MAG: amidohydrolase family protein [Thermoplasmata archaeon]
MSEILDGTIYANRRFFEGSIEIDDYRIISVDEHRVENPSRLLLPLAANCHTHIGDYCLRGKIDLSKTLEEIVRPPDGLKHRLLRDIEKDEIVKGMTSAASEMKSNGIGIFIDFREGGINGVSLLKKALSGVKIPRAIILSRPERLEYDEDEIDILLENSDGIGLSAVSDWNYAEIRQISEQVKGRKKTFSIHASETKREDIRKILDLSPDFLVHMAMANENDLISCRELDVPIIVCPRSNRMFGIPLDIAKMVDLGIAVSLGTDNAMVSSLSMIEEMRAAYSLRSNSRRLQVDEVFRLAFENPQKIINDKNLISICPGKSCNLMVVEAEGGLTPKRLIGTDVPYSVRVISSG